jgi:hypothetical protein
MIVAKAAQQGGLELRTKAIYPKYSKHDAFTLAHAIECVSFSLSQWSRYVIEAHLNSFKGFFFFNLKIKLLMPFPKNYPVVEPTKAPIQLSEGRWFEPTHGFYIFFVLFQFLKDYHSISAKKRNRNDHEKWIFMHLSTFFVKRVSGAYCGFMMLALLSKIEGIYTFNATNLHQNALKNYLKLSHV